MRIVVLNPNTTQAMTDAVVAEIVRRVPASAAVAGLTARRGAPVIDSRETFAIGAEAALATLAEVPPDATSILLACFGDPGLDALRRSTRVPVVGLAEAAVHRAAGMNLPFAIVTAGAEWVGMLRECVAACGAANLLVDVHALDGNGGQLQRDPGAFRAEVARLSARAADDGARTLILGGAAFAGLDFAIDPRLALLDALDAAVLRLR